MRFFPSSFRPGKSRLGESTSGVLYYLPEPSVVAGTIGSSLTPTVTLTRQCWCCWACWGALRPMSGMCWTSPGIAGEPSARHLGARCQGMDGMGGMEHSASPSIRSTPRTKVFRQHDSATPPAPRVHVPPPSLALCEVLSAKRHQVRAKRAHNLPLVHRGRYPTSYPGISRCPQRTGSLHSKVLSPACGPPSPPNFPSLPMLACWGLWPLPSAVEIMYSTCDRYLAASGKKVAATRRTAPAATHALTGWLSFTHFMDPEPLCSRPAAY